MKLRKLRAKLKELQREGRALSREAKEIQARIDAAHSKGDDPAEADETALAAINAKVDAKMAECDAADEAVDAEVRRIEADTRFAENGGETLPAEARDEALYARDGFHHLHDFARAVHAACAVGGGPIDPRLQAPPSAPGAAPTNFHQEQGTTEGGYMVPPAFRTEIRDLIFDEDSLLSMVDVEPTDKNAVETLKDETTPWGATGIQANWRAEGTQMSPSELETKKDMVSIHQLYAFVLATEELLSDAPRLRNRLGKKSAEAIGWKASDAIFAGSGVGQPLGVLNAPGVVTVAKESGQAADTIVVQNILNMYIRMFSSSISRAHWQANVEILPQLALMTIGDQPIWTPPRDGIRAAPGGFLLGRPIRWSDHAKQLGDKGDLTFMDPKGYHGLTRQTAPDFAESMHLYFDYNMHAFRWTFRFGGQPHLSAPVSPPNGTTTKAHFVTLAERA